MLTFNPYDLEHVAMMSDWLADKQKGIVKACPFFTKAQLVTTKTKKKKLNQKGLLRVKR